MKKERTLIAIGWHQKDRPRHWVMKEGLNAHGVHIIDCITTKKGVVQKYLDLWQQFKKLHHEADTILVPFQGHYVMPLAFLLKLRTGKKIIFDVFISLYDTHVKDRKLVSQWHPKAWCLWLLDWLSCTLADTVVIDTEEHKQYFVKSYGVRDEKIIVVPVGARTDVFKPSDTPKAHSDICTVAFWGSFIPLQGIDTILHAASLLHESYPHIHFQIIGSGQTEETMWQLAQELELTNTDFISPMPSREELVEYIHHADICLGIFGTSEKTKRVIPHKAYDTVACKKPLITAKTPAMERFFEHEKDVVYTETGNAQELADAIVQLYEQPDMRDAIAKNGHEVFVKNFTADRVVHYLIKLWAHS